MNVLESRKEHAKAAATALIQSIRNNLDDDRLVDHSCVSSWMTSFHETCAFGSKHRTMEFVMGCKINMEDVDTIPIPANGFEPNYNKTQLEEGRERLHDFVRGMNDNSIQYLDTNNLLFNGGMTEHRNVVDILFHKYHYDIRLNLLNGECIHMSHSTSKKNIVVHRPLSIAADSGGYISTEQCTLRSMLVETFKQTNDALLGGTTSTSTNTSSSPLISSFSSDAIHGSYSQESIRNALHFGAKSRIPAAFARHAVTPSTDMPIRQNNIPKVPSDPNYPITTNLRRMYRQDDPPTERPIRHLSICRARNRLSYVRNAHDDGQIRTAMEDVETMIFEDDPTNDTIQNRWDSVLHGIEPTSDLRLALEMILAERKQAEGNRNARGKTDQEKLGYDEEYRRMIQLPFDTPFYVRNGDHDDPIPTGPHDYEVFQRFTEEGLSERVN
jgi:hypothetical protein